MNRKLLHTLSHAILLALASPAAFAAGFVYEGRLDDRGMPADGRYDMRLSAYGDERQGSTLAAPITLEGVVVKDGRFRLDVDLPLVKSDQVWLEVAVRGSGEPTFATIPGRSKAIAAPLIGSCWSTTGDSGSNTGTNFIGTIDAQAFVVRTANVRSLRIEPSAALFAGSPITTNTIAGSRANTVTPGVRGVTIAGGGMPFGDSDPDFNLEGPNRVSDHYGTVGGGWNNQAGDGDGDVVDTYAATVSGGRNNTASERQSTVGGGLDNAASGISSTVGGGENNTSVGAGSTVGGGDQNTASGSISTVGGGQDNTARGSGSTVGGGRNNTASGTYSTIGGGESNCTGGPRSWAGGNRAKVRPGVDPGGTGSCNGLTYPGGLGDAGTFVWADSQDANFVSSGTNQFLVRAQGGAAINSNDPAGNALRVSGDTLRVDVLGAAGGTALCRNLANQISTCSSSARYKQDIADLQLGLETALRLHAVGYRWKDGGAADVGFVAEEIAEIDERLITRNDQGQIEGVKYDRLTTVLANAVQELAARDSLAAERLAQISVENDELRARMDRLEAALTSRTAEER